jgi:hypothetical protein
MEIVYGAVRLPEVVMGIYELSLKLNACPIFPGIGEVLVDAEMSCP